MSKEHTNALATLVKSSMTATLAAVKDVPEAQRMAQAQDGKSHPTWQIGHMTVVAANAAMGICMGRVSSLPDNYGPLFAPAIFGGQPIQSDASAYPAWDEIVDTYTKISDEVIAAIKELDDSELSEPCKGPVPEPLTDRFTNLGNGLSFIALHNIYHTGQMNLLAALDAD